MKLKLIPIIRFYLAIFDYNPIQSRSHAYYGSLNQDKYKRPYHKHYSADGQMAIIEDRKSGKTKFITWLNGNPYSSRMVWVSLYRGKTQQEAKPYYLHRDYLGSILAISDTEGKVVERRHFDAWGKLDQLKSSKGDDPNMCLAFLDRGYTGHEHFPGVGLIHMNGRMYDPMLHRFLSPDNYIQGFDSQNFNRYGYALNNPLKYTDPSGEWIQYLVGALVGGGANVVVSAVTGGLSGKGVWGGIWRGAASFAAGAAAGALTATGNIGLMALGGAITGATDAAIMGKGPVDIAVGAGIGAGVGLAFGGLSKVGSAVWKRFVGRVVPNLGRIMTPALEKAGRIVTPALERAGRFVPRPLERVVIPNWIRQSFERPALRWGRISFSIANKLQAKYKHATDFNIHGNYNLQNAGRFRKALQDHIMNPNTRLIIGSYHRKSAYHYINNGLNVITEPNGELISGWRLSPGQLDNIYRSGNL